MIPNNLSWFRVAGRAMLLFVFTGAAALKRLLCHTVSNYNNYKNGVYYELIEKKYIG